MKNIFFLFLICFILSGCSDDDKVTAHQNEKFIETGNLAIQYNGETLNFTDINIVTGGPDSDYALELSSVILYDDVHATKYSLVLVFNKNEAGDYTLYTITLGVDDRQGTHSFYLKGYYAYTSGIFAVADFNHSTTTQKKGNYIIVTGNFSGTLLPGNKQSEPIQVENGQFSANFNLAF